MSDATSGDPGGGVAARLRWLGRGRNALLPVTAIAAVLFALHIYLAYVQPEYDFPDDIVYTSAAIRLLLGRTCATIADNACNYEHPPLAKLLMALGFEVFGRTQVIGAEVGVGANQFGGRIFQMAMDFAAPPVFYLTVDKLSGNWKIAAVSSVLLAVDPLYYTLSSTASLDPFMLFFSLVALLPYAYRDALGDGVAGAASGALFGLSLLSKEGAVFILLALLAFELLVDLRPWRTRVRVVTLTGLTAAFVFIVGLQLFDVTFTSFPSFVAQLEVMLPYLGGTAAQQTAWLMQSANCSLYAGLCPTDRSLVPHILYSGLPLAPVLVANCVACWSSTNPMDWLTYFPPVVFPTDLVLAPNYLAVWLSYAWVPFGLLSFKRLRQTPGGRVLLLAVLLFLFNACSNLLIFGVLGRAVFESYFLPAVPALAIGAAYVCTLPPVPRWLRYSILIALLASAVLLSPLTYHAIHPGPQVCSAC